MHWSYCSVALSHWYVVSVFAVDWGCVPAAHLTVPSPDRDICRSGTDPIYWLTDGFWDGEAEIASAATSHQHLCYHGYWHWQASPGHQQPHPTSIPATMATDTDRHHQGISSHIPPASLLPRLLTLTGITRASAATSHQHPCYHGYWHWQASPGHQQPHPTSIPATTATDTDRHHQGISSHIPPASLLPWLLTLTGITRASAATSHQHPCYHGYWHWQASPGHQQPHPTDIPATMATDTDRHHQGIRSHIPPASLLPWLLILTGINKASAATSHWHPCYHGYWHWQASPGHQKPHPTSLLATMADRHQQPHPASIPATGRAGLTDTAKHHQSICSHIPWTHPCDSQTLPGITRVSINLLAPGRT